MRGGRLRFRVTLQSPTGDRDAVGERVTTWADVAENVPADINPISGREEVLAAQREATTSHIVRIRYDSQWAALDESWRVLYGARVFTVDAKRNIGERNCEIVLDCTEGERQE